MKGSKLERAREIKGIKVVIDMYNVKLHFDSLYNAGVKHKLSEYTRKSICGGNFYSKL